MALISGIFGGLLCGLVPAVILGFLSVLPHMGWTEYAILPVFFLVGLPSALVIGSKTSQPR